VKLVESIHSAENKDSQYVSMSIVVNGATKVIESHIKCLGLDSKETKEASQTRTVTEFLTEFLANLADED
jgi:hypothetical protein